MINLIKYYTPIKTLFRQLSPESQAPQVTESEGDQGGRAKKKKEENSAAQQGTQYRANRANRASKDNATEQSVDEQQDNSGERRLYPR